MKHATTLLLFLFSPLIAFCPYGNEQVCGSDNKTYANLCELNKSTAVLQYKGVCVFKLSEDGTTREANCSSEFTPVCGKDGVTYGNECRMRYWGFELAYEGPCGVENYDPVIFLDKICECSYDWHPVCTKNSNINFESLCFVRCIHQLEGSFDSCSSPCECTTEYDPVCSLNGVTYDNECQLKCVGATKHLRGECQSILFDCDAGCSRVFSPVCGEDGETYRNKCFASCQNKKIAKEGICDKDSRHPALRKKTDHSKSKSALEALCERCSREIRINPVCSEDGVTYENECQCACQNEGVCPKYADGPCPNADMMAEKCTHCKALPLDPVCGNDYRTYDNLCYLQCNGRALYKKGQCNSFGQPQRSSFDMRTEKFNNRIPQKKESRNQQLMRIQGMVNQIGSQMANGNTDPRLVEALANLLQVLQGLKKHG